MPAVGAQNRQEIGKVLSSCSKQMLPRGAPQNASAQFSRGGPVPSGPQTCHVGGRGFELQAFRADLDAPTRDAVVNFPNPAPE
jgi:hypothetical protein